MQLMQIMQIYVFFNPDNGIYICIFRNTIRNKFESCTKIDLYVLINKVLIRLTKSNKLDVDIRNVTY